METTLTGLLVHEMSQNDILNALKVQIVEFAETKQETNAANALVNLFSSDDSSTESNKAYCHGGRIRSNGKFCCF
jgi:hypothetical protein